MKIKRILAFSFILTAIFGMFAFTSDFNEAKLKSELFAPPCIMKVTNNTSNFSGVSVNSRNLYSYPNSVEYKGCPCTGYIQLYTGGPITWELINNTPNTINAGQVVISGSLSGFLDLDNYNFIPQPCPVGGC